MKNFESYEEFKAYKEEQKRVQKQYKKDKPANTVIRIIAAIFVLFITWEIWLRIFHYGEGVSDLYVYDWLTGQSKFFFDTIDKICMYSAPLFCLAAAFTKTKEEIMQEQTDLKEREIRLREIEMQQKENEKKK